MQKIISTLLILFVTFGLVITEAQAKRFGGGRSFGVSRSASSFSSARPASSPMSGAAAASNRSKWLGPLAGLAAGGLLASLFMGNGFASGMMSWLLVAGVIMLLLNLLRSFSRGSMQAPRSQAPHQMYHQNMSSSAAPTFGFNQAASGQSSLAPANFDEEDFLRKAKVQFIRLQAAYDQKNLDDISMFTSPDVFAEVKLQLQERGEKQNVTDVVTLNAKLLDITSEYQTMVASVNFTGLIKEEVNQPALSLDEIWHFQKPATGGTWSVTGIQQN